MTKDGLRTPNYWGSLTQAATVRVGNVAGEEAHAPVSSLLPMVHPNDIELGGWDKTGVDLPPVPADFAEDDLGDLLRVEPIGLPGLSEPETVRHYVRLSQQNHALDLALYPLGSCTMKHNPRINEKVAALPGFLDSHPMAEAQHVQGNLELMYTLQEWLAELTGLPAVTLHPSAGAAGELTGVMLILLFALGHCLPIMIAGSSTAAVRRLTESETWIGSGAWFRKGAGVVIGLLGIYFIGSPFLIG